MHLKMIKAFVLIKTHDQITNLYFNWLYLCDNTFWTKNIFFIIALWTLNDIFSYMLEYLRKENIDAICI